MKIKTHSKKLFSSIFILVFSFLLSSCSNPVSYSVEKEHIDKVEVIYNMISGLANCGMQSTQTSNNDLRVILDNLLNGGEAINFGTVMY